MFYILIILTITFIATLAYAVYINIGLKVQNRFLQQYLNDDKLAIEALEKDKVENVEKIAQLTSKVEYQSQLISEFEKLQAESKQSTKAALFDLGNQLSKQLIEIHKKETKESRESSEKNIREASTKFNSEFERVVNMLGALNKEVSQSKDTVDVIRNSLLSPSGAGSLAEITLENILKSSGLRKNVDYIMQYNMMTEEEVTLRPDAVIFLPGNKLMVIDAKASKFLVDDQGDLKNLAKTMNTHLRSLSSKNYADTVRKNFNTNKNNHGNIVTLMFVPSEHAIEKIIESDNDFMHKSWKENIFPVGPAGLMNMLSFAKFQISEQMMLHNHQKIIEEVKKLMSSVGTMAEYSSRLGKSISSAVNNYDKFAASFNHNFLSKARNISRMGIEGGLKKNQESLQRLQVVTSKSELIEVAPEKESSEIKKLEDA